MNDNIDSQETDAVDIITRLRKEIELNKQGGFFDLPKLNICNNPEHNPPTHIHIPQGKGYRHICPGCGKEQVIIPQQISF